MSDSFASPWTVAPQAPLWHSPGKNTRVGCHFLLQGIFPTQGSNPRVLCWQVDSLPLSYQGSPCTARDAVCMKLYFSDTCCLTGRGFAIFKVLTMMSIRKYIENNVIGYLPLPLYTSSVHFRSVAQSCPTLCDPMNRRTPGLPVHHQLLGFISNSCPSSRWCHPAISSSVIPFSSCPQSLPASGSFPMSQLFAWGGQKYWSFSFSISPSNDHPGLISFRMAWLDLLAVQVQAPKSCYDILNFNKYTKWL